MAVLRGAVRWPRWSATPAATSSATRPGPKIFQREDSKIFKKQYVEKTHEFFEKYGNRAIVLARFVPVVRTFITVMAGVGTMSFRRFMIYSAVGGAIWAIGVTLLGYYLGTIPFVANNVEVMILGVRRGGDRPGGAGVPPGPGREEARRGHRRLTRL